MLDFWTKAVIFQKMKAEIDAYIEEYGQDNAPPPWSTFTLPNDIQEANFHMIQKIFDGAFQVKSSTDNRIRVKADLTTQFDVIYSSSSAPSPVTCKYIEALSSAC